MKKILSILTIISLGIILIPGFVFAEPSNLNEGDSNKVDFSLFHSETCPHCRAEIRFIESTLRPEYEDSVDFNLYELGTKENRQIFSNYATKYKHEISSIPVTFIDGQIISGYSSDDTTGETLRSAIKYAIERRGSDGGDISSSHTQNINVPIFGEINAKEISLPLITFILGILDGFNPCAMWALLFLISLLLGMKNRKRMWLLGSIFIFASGLVYFAFMAAWLHAILLLGFVAIVRNIIGAVAIGVGSINLKDFWEQRKSDALVCKVGKKGKTQEIFAKIKDIVYKDSLIWSIAGITILGFSVNLVEMFCSAGFPAVFTQILAINELAMWKRYMYMFGYIIFYMLDDMLVFVLAMVTLKSRVFGTKYAKYASVVGGILMIFIGLLLIIKPEWLMFS